MKERVLANEWDLKKAPRISHCWAKAGAFHDAILGWSTPWLLPRTVHSLAIAVHKVVTSLSYWDLLTFLRSEIDSVHLFSRGLCNTHNGGFTQSFQEDQASRRWRGSKRLQAWTGWLSWHGSTTCSSGIDKVRRCSHWTSERDLLACILFGPVGHPSVRDYPSIVDK